MYKLRLLLIVPLIAVGLAACGGGDEVEPAASDSAGLIDSNVSEAPADSNASASNEMSDPSGAEPAVEPTEPASDSAMEATADPASDAGAVEGEGVVYAVVPEESVASYSVEEEFFAGAVERLGRQLGLTDTVGRTSAMDGQMTLVQTPDGPVVESGQFIVDISTLESDSSGRDRKIREEWLQSGTYPQAVFTVNAINGFPADYAPGQPATFELAGDLTIRDITQPVVFTVTAVQSDGTIEGEAETQILMTDYGFEPPEMMNMFSVANEVTVMLDFTLRESAGQAG